VRAVRSVAVRVLCPVISGLCVVVAWFWTASGPRVRSPQSDWAIDVGSVPRLADDLAPPRRRPDRERPCASATRSPRAPRTGSSPHRCGAAPGHRLRLVEVDDRQVRIGSDLNGAFLRIYIERFRGVRGSHLDRAFERDASLVDPLREGSAGASSPSRGSRGGCLARPRRPCRRAGSRSGRCRYRRSCRRRRLPQRLLVFFRPHRRIDVVALVALLGGERQVVGTRLPGDIPPRVVEHRQLVRGPSGRNVDRVEAVVVVVLPG